MAGAAILEPRGARGAFANIMSKGKSVEESIRIQAYLLSEEAGHPSGMESFFWRQAEALVINRAAAAKNRAASRLKAKKLKTKVKAKPAKAAKAAKPAKTSRKKKDA